MASGILLTEYEIVTEAEPNYQLPSEKERLVKAMGLNLYLYMLSLSNFNPFSLFFSGWLLTRITLVQRGTVNPSYQMKMPKTLKI